MKIDKAVLVFVMFLLAVGFLAPWVLLVLQIFY